MKINLFYLALRVGLPGALAFVATAAQAQTTILNWSSYTGNIWNSSNGYSRNYTLGGGYGNVTIAMSGSTGEFQANFPAVENIANKGGFASPMNVGLSLRLDLTSNSGAVTSTFTFDRPGGIQNLGFWISDMDASGTSWRDRLTFSANRAAGGTTTPTLTPNVAANYNISPGVIATKSTVGDIGNTSSNGNVFVRFPEAITSFSIVYDNDTGTQANPDTQHITIHSLMVVPEPGTLCLALPALGLLALRRRSISGRAAG